MRGFVVLTDPMTFLPKALSFPNIHEKMLWINPRLERFYEPSREYFWTGYREKECFISDLRFSSLIWQISAAEEVPPQSDGGICRDEKRE